MASLVRPLLEAHTPALWDRRSSLQEPHTMPRSPDGSCLSQKAVCLSQEANEAQPSCSMPHAKTSRESLSGWASPTSPWTVNLVNLVNLVKRSGVRSSPQVRLVHLVLVVIQVRLGRLVLKVCGAGTANGCMRR